MSDVFQHQGLFLHLSLCLCLYLFCILPFPFVVYLFLFFFSLFFFVFMFFFDLSHAPSLSCTEIKIETSASPFVAGSLLPNLFCFCIYGHICFYDCLCLCLVRAILSRYTFTSPFVVGALLPRGEQRQQDLARLFFLCCLIHRSHICIPK